MTTTAPQSTESKTLASGRVVAIAGPVIDVEFPPHALPEINGAVEVDVMLEGTPETITADRRRPGAVHLPEGHRRTDPRRGSP
jgi:hypothetical protein